jgi:cysteine desulfurase/selenocysteine lyase
MEMARTMDSAYDVDAIRADFPILDRQVHGKPLVYLDNAASAQRPRQVIEAVSNFYSIYNANIHRGVHQLSQEATVAYEAARDTMAGFINAGSRSEVVFTRGTTESINLVAQSFMRPQLQPGDEILITHMEHHSNIVPWQILCEQTGAVLKVVPINRRGELDLQAFDALLPGRVKLLAMAHISNALGTINPVAELTAKAKACDIPVLIDGAQAAPHAAIDVQEIGCDFYCVSGHKMYGPTGIGILWAREPLLDAMPPYQGGGEMIAHVSFEKTVYNEVPGKFEAGTPNIAGAIGMGVAADYLAGIGLDKIAEYEHDLLNYTTGRLLEVEGLQLIGTARHKAGVAAFTIEGVHPNDLGTLIDHFGVAIRTGHHCAMPVMQFFGVPATSRASLGIYNTRAEIDVLVNAITKARKMLV